MPQQSLPQSSTPEAAGLPHGAGFTTDIRPDLHRTKESTRSSMRSTARTTTVLGFGEHGVHRVGHGAEDAEYDEERLLNLVAYDEGRDRPRYQFDGEYVDDPDSKGGNGHDNNRIPPSAFWTKAWPKTIDVLIMFGVSQRQRDD